LLGIPSIHRHRYVPMKKMQTTAVGPVLY